MNLPPTGRAPCRVRRLLHTVKKLVERPGMLARGERIVVGLSGGADSLCLLHVLQHLNLRLNKDWQLLPVHVDPGFPGWRADRVEKLCNRLGLQCVVHTLDIPERLQTSSLNSCYVCARARRKALFETAAAANASKIALAHHMEDVNETLLMNLLMTASGSTFLPRQEFFGGKFVVIRPLYYAEKQSLRAYLRYHRLKPVRNRCPMLQKGIRYSLRRFLERLYRRDRRIITNLFWGIHNLKSAYLPGDSPQSLSVSDQNL